MASYTSNKSVSNIIIYIVACLAAALFLLPLYYTLVNSVRGVYDLPVVTVPTVYHWENYWLAVTRIPFLSYLKSSLIIVSISVSLSVFINFMLGYAFARMTAPLKDLWFGVLISLMMIPGIATLIPQYILFNNLNIGNTYWIWLLQGIGGSPFYTFLYRQFFASIPKEMEEAARIDGCHTFQIIFRIFLPNSIPVVAVVIMFEFLTSWSDNFLPFMYLTEEKWPLATALTGVNYTLPNRPEVQLQPVILASSVLLMIPTIIIYFFGQKYLKEGMITSGLKG